MKSPDPKIIPVSDSVTDQPPLVQDRTVAAAAPQGKARAGGDAMTPEFRLAAACCRWPPSPARDAAVRATADTLGGWERFAKLVGPRHRVAGLACAALLSAGVVLPQSAARRLGRQAQRIAQRNRLFAAETVHLHRALGAAGIPALALKGTSLAQLVYGSPDIKHAGDIDLLVPPDRADDALHVLEREGYALSYPAERLDKAQRRAVLRYAREVQLVHYDKAVRLELQWRAATNPFLLKGVDAHSPAQQVVLPNGDRIPTLANDDLFAYLCVHGAQHAWSRLKWLADLNAFISGHVADIVRLYGHAKRIGAGPSAAQALLLCRRLFALELPAVLVDELAHDRKARWLAAIAERTMADTHAEAETARGFFSLTRVSASQFLLGSGSRFLMAQLRAELVRIRDVIDLPLPPALQFLYPFLRLPLWLWRRTRSMVIR